MRMAPRRAHFPMPLWKALPALTCRQQHPLKKALKLQDITSLRQGPQQEVEETQRPPEQRVAHRQSHRQDLAEEPTT